MKQIDHDILITFLDYLKEGIIVVDKDKNIEFVNRYATKFLNSKDFIGKNFKEIINDDYLYSIISHDYDKDTKIEVNIEDRKYVVNIYHIKNKKIIHLQDITPFELYKQAKKDFVSNVSHELKTPISVLKSVIETIEDEVKNENTNKFIDMAKKRINQMDMLINDLLILARLESQEDQVKKAKYNLYYQLESIFDDLSYLTKEKNIKLINNVTKDFEIYADEQKLSIAFKNLIENGIKYNVQNGYVEASAKSDNRYNFISVKDSGIGIPKESIPLIFERFYRVDKSRSRNIGGTGLGLSIVKHIIEAHKGTISVYSKLNEGSEFIIKLPKFD